MHEQLCTASLASAPARQPHRVHARSAVPSFVEAIHSRVRATTEDFVRRVRC